MLKVPRTCGLLNREYTCYVNVVLQVLARSPDVVRWAQEYTHEGEGPAEDCIRCILRDTILEMRKVPSPAPFIPQDLLNWIRQKTQAFVAGVQADSEEVLIFLMRQSGLDFFKHEETEKLLRNVDGHLEEQISTAPTIGLGTYHVLAVGQPESTSTQKLLDDYISVRNSRTCRAGDGRVCTERNFSILPKMLMMKLNRFTYVNNKWIKNRKPCTMDSQVSIMNIHNENITYNICGYINHVGAIPSVGHYEANVIDFGEWFSYSDDHVVRKTLTTKDTYLVFYKQASTEEVPEELLQYNQDVVFSEQDLQSDDELMEGVQTVTTEDECWWKKCDSGLQADVQTWRTDLSSEVHLKWLTKCRLLVICIPKTCQGSSFRECYDAFIRRDETLLYTITYRHARLFYQIRTDPWIQEKYNVFAQPIGAKIGKKSVSLWVAEAAMVYILYTLINTSVPRYEFFFDLNPACMITQFITRNWEVIKTKVGRIVTQCINKEKLFCVEGCSRDCVMEYKVFHRSIMRMALVPPLEEISDESLLQGWRFTDKLRDLSRHPLQELLCLPSGSTGDGLGNQIIRHLTDCKISSSYRCAVYLLMIVDSDTPHTPNDLLHMWTEQTATFSVYVGLTKQGPFRREHLYRSSNRKKTAVTENISDNSTIYLVTSQEYQTYNEGLIAEAQLIAVLRRFQEEEKKTGIQYRFNVLNRNLPAVHLFESNATMRQMLDCFMMTGKRPFRFIGEPYKQSETENGILQRFLVHEIIQKAQIRSFTGRKYVCDYPNCGKPYRSGCDLIKHKRSHEDYLYVCPISECGESFPKVEDFRAHKITHWSKTYTCDFFHCVKSYSNITSLRAHKKNYHSNETFVCDYGDCKIPFKRLGDLVRHRLIHKDYLYVCLVPDCGEAFSKNVDFRMHKYTHMDKRYVCNVPDCEAAYTRKRDFDQHKRTHQGYRYVCDYPNCTRSYARKHDFDYHKRKHKEKQYACDYKGCGQQFFREDRMRAHKLEHLVSKNPKRNDCATLLNKQRYANIIGDPGFVLLCDVKNSKEFEDFQNRKHQ